MWKWVSILVGIYIAWTYRNTGNLKRPLLSHYDYIVVGAGSAGGILAARLSEDPQYTVALVEAGPDDDQFPNVKFPLRLFTLQKTEADWQYESVPQNHSCQAMIGKKSAWPRGKGLGGTSLINGMMAVRGSRYDYDHWKKMGNKGWGYDDVLPYFKKVEKVTKESWIKSGFRGDKGPVSIEVANPFAELTDAMQQSAKLIGLPDIDYNGEDQIGWSLTQSNTEKGTRASTSYAYIKPALKRDNLYVITSAHVTQVLFEDKKAVGVRLLRDGKMQNIFAKKEVILSAGAIGSAQILMLSGIGPKKHLNDFKIKVVADLPVGKNLYDHILVDAPAYTLEKPISYVSRRYNMFLEEMKHQLLGYGILGWSGLSMTGFIRSKYQSSNEKNPHIQYILMGTLPGQDKEEMETLRNCYNIEPEIYKSLHGNMEGKDGFVVLPNLVQPESVGEIRLRSTNPFEHPLIDPNYLSKENDVKKTVEAIQEAIKLFDQPPMKTIGANRIKRVHPLCKDQKYDSEEYWSCYVRSNTLTVYHPIGTCKMGPENDNTTVVTPDLKVKHVKGLRVVDASIMPYITSSNTNFPVMMIAEKAADIIKSQA